MTTSLSAALPERSCSGSNTGRRRARSGSTGALGNRGPLRPVQPYRGDRGGLPAQPPADPGGLRGNLGEAGFDGRRCEARRPPRRRLLPEAELPREGSPHRERRIPGGARGTPPRIARALIEDSIWRAPLVGFDAIQFNLVFASNPARSLYEELGWRKIGQIPEAVEGEDAIIYWRSVS